MAQTYGLALIPWSPLAGGFLTGKYRRGEKGREGARYQAGNEWADRQFTDAAFDVLSVVEAIGKEKRCTPSQLAVAWCAQQPGITSPIIGPRTVEQLKDNLGAATAKLSDEDRARIEAVAPPGRAIVPYYEADFGPHKFRW